MSFMFSLFQTKYLCKIVFNLDIFHKYRQLYSDIRSFSPIYFVFISTIRKTQIHFFSVSLSKKMTQRTSLLSMFPNMQSLLLTVSVRKTAQWIRLPSDYVHGCTKSGVAQSPAVDAAGKKSKEDTVCDAERQVLEKINQDKYG